MNRNDFFFVVCHIVKHDYRVVQNGIDIIKDWDSVDMNQNFVIKKGSHLWKSDLSIADMIQLAESLGYEF